MKNQGCEIQAVGVNYIITEPKRECPLRLFSREPKQSPEDAKSKTVRHVLKDVHCTAKPWEILAIVGPSGAGKSSMLEILAGKLKPQKASIFLNKQTLDVARFKKISGYVTQKDSLFPLLTVEETLMFTARLRLSLPATELRSRVKSLMAELGLSHVSSARVGDDRVRGISGGERRRVSVGVEIVHDPCVLMLDEPTSGLDSTASLQIIDLLKKMAETRGRTIILSIHQPGFRIVKLFNSILLLANGRVLHHGTVEILSVSMMEMGLYVPIHVNVVEFAIESIETFEQQNQSMSSNKGRGGTGGHQEDQSGKNSKFTLEQLFLRSTIIDDEEFMNASRVLFSEEFANSRLKETIILSQRFWKNISRTKELFACRSLQMLISGLVLGSIFYDLKNNLVGAEERVGLFAFILTFLLTSTTEALPIFLQEREILMKETSCGSYRVSSYAIANGLVYLPFLLILASLFSIPLYWLVGLHRSFMAFFHFLLLIWLILYTANSVVVCISALAPNFIVGNSIVSGVMGSFFLFSGYFISKHGIPSYWIFMHYISLFKYPFEGFLINEFAGSGCLESMLGACVVSGEDVLKEVGDGQESRWKNATIMVCFILVYRFFSYVILRCRCSNRGLEGIFF